MLSGVFAFIDFIQQLFDTESFALLNEWTAFVRDHGPSLISKDIFFQTHLFAKSFRRDLSAWEDDGAWPILIDEFVEHMKLKDSNDKSS